VAIRWRIPLALIVLAAAVYAVVFGFIRSAPDPTVSPVPRATAIPSRSDVLAWPSQGQAAVGVEGVGLLGSRGAARPTPIASVAKVMSAYVVLRDHPLAANESGPMITVSPAEVAAYRADQASGQSVVLVRAGERLNERQALEALLLPSGNNIATLLADWDAGSQSAFVAKMNTEARALGLSRTHYVDASGFRSGTVGTATDETDLALTALRNATFRQIVATAQVTLPGAGRQYNLDAMLGRDGIVGVKTGSTSQAGGCFVFAAHVRIAGRTVTVVGAVLHQMTTKSQPSVIDGAFQASTALLASVRRALTRYVVVRRGATLATIETPWMEPVAAQASHSAQLIGWPGLKIETTVHPTSNLSAPIAADQAIGMATITAGAQRVVVPLLASQPVPEPSFAWRLEHP
jgi:serine-type D-Ala-D-Ala carboxypeptidase (penicillin-binding protein 5/6)